MALLRRHLTLIAISFALTALIVGLFFWGTHILYTRIETTVTTAIDKIQNEFPIQLSFDSVSFDHKLNLQVSNIDFSFEETPDKFIKIQIPKFKVISHMDWKQKQIIIDGFILQNARLKTSANWFSQSRVLKKETPQNIAPSDLKQKILVLHQSLQENQVQLSDHLYLKTDDALFSSPNASATINGQVHTSLLSWESKNIPAVNFDANISNGEIQHQTLAETPVGNINFKTQGTLTWNPLEKIIAIEKIKLAKNAVEVSAQANLHYGQGIKIQTETNLNPTPIQNLIDALPQDFIPIIKGAEVQGNLSFHINLQADSDKPSQLVFDPEVQIENYKLITPPSQANIKELNQTFEHTVFKNGQKVKEFSVGPKNKNFVRYDSLGDNIVKAVLTCEDGSFFSHNGFRLEHIQDSIVENMKKDKFVRGGSTISMQLTKNLFLNSNKTISRKFQEMILTYAIEQELPKKRMLEIYMNIIEWGPKIYGVGQASQHYFAKRPSQLDPLEAAFMASIIASPVRYHYMYSKGEVTDTWSTYLKDILGKMHLKDSSAYDFSPYKPEFGWVRKKREKEEQHLALNTDKKKRRKKR